MIVEHEMKEMQVNNVMKEEETGLNGRYVGGGLESSADKLVGY